MNKVRAQILNAEGLIFDIQRFSLDDGPGIRTVVFFMGCPLNCPWCHNPESKEIMGTIMHNSKLCICCKNCQNICTNGSISFDTKKFKLDKRTCTRCGKCVEVCINGALKQIGKKISANKIMEEVLKDKNYYDETNGGITLSGGEPLFQAKFAEQLLKEANKHNVNTAIETSGYVDIEVLKQINKYVDLFIYDIKHIDNLIHKKVIGKGNDKIWKALNYLKDTANEIWIRIPIVPGFNDEIDIISEIFYKIKEIKKITRIELLPYCEFGKYKYENLGIEYKCNEIRPPSTKLMKMLGGIFKKDYNGKVVIKEA